MSSFNHWCVPARLLKKNLPLADFHLHTSWTDGQSSVKEYLEVAQKTDLEAIAFTEHVDTNTMWFEKFKNEIKLQNKSLQVFCGAEVRNADYQMHLNAKPELLNKADLILGVVHRYPHRQKPPPVVYEFSELTSSLALELEIDSFRSLVANPRVDIIGHPFASFASHFGAMPAKTMKMLIKEAKKAGKIIEINPRYISHPRQFLEILLVTNPLVSLGSNAHHVSELQSAYYFVNEYLS